ncbi:MAG TPA: sigma-E factor regulatory protein RseB domain-containing protein [Cryptosporangiaceae bacterium]|nr:sigma-E factor regulatory protein RseB domain-containing protein [Cryptosporangiaceae bacterium]
MRAQPVLHAARRVVLVVGAGALGAAVCSTAVRNVLPPAEDLRSIRTANATLPRPRVLMSGEQRAVDLLRRAGRADNALAYRGAKFFGSWSDFGHTSVLAQVSHHPDEGTRLVFASGSAPSRRLVAADRDTGLDERMLAALTRRYRLRVAGVEGCIGRRATVVEALRADGGVAGRFWLDERTGLTLRRELFDARGRQVRLTLFVDLRVGDGSRPVSVPASDHPRPRPLPTAEAGRVLDREALDGLRADGWVLPDLLPAGLTLFGAREVTVAGTRAVHLTFSDGLFMLSMFVQRGRLDPDDLPAVASRKLGDATVYAQAGLYRHLSWEGSGLVYTVITDAPDESVAAVVATMPHRPHDGSVLGRMSRGVSRMGSLLDPFD